MNRLLPTLLVMLCAAMTVLTAPLVGQPQPTPATNATTSDNRGLSAHVGGTFVTLPVYAVDFIQADCSSRVRVNSPARLVFKVWREPATLTGLKLTLHLLRQGQEIMPPTVLPMPNPGERGEFEWLPKEAGTVVCLLRISPERRGGAHGFDAPNPQLAVAESSRWTCLVEAEAANAVDGAKSPLAAPPVEVLEVALTATPRHIQTAKATVKVVEVELRATVKVGRRMAILLAAAYETDAEWPAATLLPKPGEFSGLAKTVESGTHTLTHRMVYTERFWPTAIRATLSVSEKSPHKDPTLNPATDRGTAADWLQLRQWRWQTGTFEAPDLRLTH